MEEVKRICPFCEKVFVNEINITKHITVTHFNLTERNRKSVQNTTSEETKEKLQSNSKRVFEKNEGNVKETNGTTFSLNVQFENVVDNLAEKSRTRYFCENCSKYFNSHSAMSYHNKRIHEKLRYPCDNCPKQLASRQKLQQHKESKKCKP